MSDITTIGALTLRERRLEVVRAQITKPGANPKNLFETLHALMDEDYGESEGLRFLEDCRDVVGVDPRYLLQILGLRDPQEHHLPALAQMHDEVRHRLNRWLADALAPAGPHGTNQHAPEAGGGCATSSSNTGSAEHIVRRLKRDDPELAEKVIEGEISADAAAKKKGYRRRRISVPVDDPVAAANVLLRHFRKDRLDALVDALRSQ